MKIIKRVIASALSLCLLPSAAFANGTEDKKETIELALISDSHLFSNTLYADNKYANEAVISETRLELESEAILDKALGEIKAASPDVVLHCGDITSNGEYVNMERVKDKLDTLQTNLPDAKICVVDGNHDINNSYAYDFTGEKPVAAKRVLPTDFREIYASYGYGTDSELYKSSGDDQGSLSYVTDIADGITLIALDTCKYSSDTNALYDDAQQTGGELSEELLGWAADKAKSAKAKGNLVLVMCHHALVKHYTIDDKYMNAYMKNFTIDNWEHIADTLADAGVTAVLTGHKHNDDTAKHISPNGNVIYDIATPSLVEYPCAYKTVTLTKNEDGTYDFKTGTHYINNITYTNPAANAEVTIDDLPSYAIEKAGLNKDMIEPAANHLLTAALYSIQQAEGGLGGYLAQRLDCEPDKVGEVLAEKALKSIPTEGEEPKVIENNFIGKLTISRNAESVICVNETSSGNATITLHISELVDLINNTVTAVNTTLSEADLTHVHEKSELQKEVVAFIVDFLKPILTTPIKGYDPYNVPQTGTTAIEIIADGYNAFGEGNEAFASEELKNQREEWRALVKSEDFSKLVNEQYVNAVNGLFENINDREKSKYKLILNTLCSVPVDMSKLMTIEGSTVATELVTSLIGSCDNLGALLKSILQGINTVSLLAGNNPVSGALSKLCGNVVSGVNLAMTTDTNVEEDRNLNIGSVRFASEKNSGKAVAVYAWYKDGALVDVSRTDVDVKQGNNATYFETGKTNFDFGKIFVWDSLEGMKPLKIN